MVRSHDPFFYATYRGECYDGHKATLDSLVDLTVDEKDIKVCKDCFTPQYIGKVGQVEPSRLQLIMGWLFG